MRVNKNFSFDTEVLTDLEAYCKHPSNKGTSASEVANEALKVYLKKELKKLENKTEEEEPSD